MTQIKKVLYTAKTHTIGGRETGVSRSSDGRLDVKLSTPDASGTGTNPEQLLAAGWSACFVSSIKIEAARMNVMLPEPLLRSRLGISPWGPCRSVCLSQAGRRWQVHPGHERASVRS
jgi:organic hydroperoxide reductase OsmC/OhrA